MDNGQHFTLHYKNNMFSVIHLRLQRNEIFLRSLFTRYYLRVPMSQSCYSFLFLETIFTPLFVTFCFHAARRIVDEGQHIYYSLLSSFIRFFLLKF